MVKNTFRNTAIKIEEVQRLLRNKTRVFNAKVNPALLAKVDKAILEDRETTNRTELFERCFLKYLSERSRL